MKQLTAVDLLYQALTETWYDKKTSKEIFRKCKAIEKYQIIDAWEMGKISIDKTIGKIELPQSPIKYYNEMYGK